jgi:DNA-binding protein Alba
MSAPDKTKYRRVVKAEGEEASPLTVRVQAYGKIGSYVSAACALLDAPAGEVRVVGRGRAINRAVTVAEVLRRKVPGVHQCTALSSVKVTDEYTPLEVGLEVRFVAACATPPRHLFPRQACELTWNCVLATCF